MHLNSTNDQWWVFEQDCLIEDGMCVREVLIILEIKCYLS